MKHFIINYEIYYYKMNYHKIMIANEYFATVPIEILYNSLRVTKHLRMLMKAVW